MMRLNGALFALLCSCLSVACVGSNQPASDASSVNSPGNTGPDITTGPGAGEPTDATPNTANTGADPDTENSRSTGSSGPETSSSNAAPSASPVH